jgi:hypothetical protein
LVVSAVCRATNSGRIWPGPSTKASQSGAEDLLEAIEAAAQLGEFAKSSAIVRLDVLRGLLLSEAPAFGERDLALLERDAKMPAAALVAQLRVVGSAVPIDVDVHAESPRTIRLAEPHSLLACATIFRAISSSPRSRCTSLLPFMAAACTCASRLALRVLIALSQARSRRLFGSGQNPVPCDT